MKWVIVIVIIVAAVGAGSYFLLFAPQPEEEQPKGPAQPTAAQQQREFTEAEMLALAEQKLEALRRLARTNPNDIIGMEAYLQEIEKLAPKSATGMKARQVYNTASGKHDSSAMMAYDKLSAQIKEEFEKAAAAPTTSTEEKMKDYQRLLNLFDKYPAQYMSTEYATRLLKLKEPIKKAVEACQAYENIRYESVKLIFGKNYEAAIAKLNEFPERFKDSEWEPVRQKLIAEYQAKHAAVQAEKKKEQALTYYDLYHGQPLDKSDWTVEGSWEVRDGVLIGQAGADSNSVFAHTHGDDWVDIVLKMRMRLARGSITIAVRGTEVAPQMLRYDPISLSTPGTLEANKWYTLIVKLRGKDYVVTADPPLPNVQEFFGEKARGPVAIWVKGGSELHIKWVKVGFYDKIPSSFVNEANKQLKDGRAEKPSEEEKEEE